MGIRDLEIISLLWRCFFMGRKAKYSKEFKLEIVKRYLKGESASSLANEYSIGEKRGMNIIGEWVNYFNYLISFLHLY